jgi:hypothetical protein
MLPYLWEQVNEAHASAASADAGLRSEKRFRTINVQSIGFYSAKYTTNDKDVKQDRDQRRGDPSTENALVGQA